ncbi:unnamed protein product [Camellia sinensis]
MESRSSATGAIAGGVVAGAALLFLAIAWRWQRKPEDSFFDVPAEESLEVHLEQLKRKRWFGKEYKGRLADGSLMAVKILKEERTQGGELLFQTDVEMVSMAVHQNLLHLHGFCMTPIERLLVYPFMSNGSVASY